MQVEENYRANGLIRVLAQLISYVFHPLFMPVYVTAFIVYQYPYYFAGFDGSGSFLIIMRVFINLCFFPALVVFLLWRLKFAGSIKLRTQKERIIPYAASLLFYFWTWYVVRNQPEMPPLFVHFLFGSFMAISGAWLANIFIKISMHTTAAGGAVAYLLILSFGGDMAMTGYLTVAILLGGLIGSARLLVSDHSYTEVYAGFIVGIVAQMAAGWITG